MADEPMSGPGQMTLPEAAGVLHLPVSSIEALVGAGYLRPSATLRDGPRFAMGDLKAFLARNVDADIDDERSAEAAFGELDDLDPDALFSALDERAGSMARRALDLFVTIFPEAAGWGSAQQARFIEDARSRFEAILAVASLGDDVDEILMAELESVGADAAESGAPLLEILAVLRISRDLVVQTAVEVAEERGRHWGLALSLVLTRVLPAVDRLTDAVAQGYWEAIVGREEESKARYESVVEHATDGVYEADLDGRVQYANSALALILGRRLVDFVGSRLVDVIVPDDGRAALEALLSEDASRRTELAIVRPDGVRREIVVFTFPRYEGEDIVGFQGIVRDVSAEVEIESQKNEFLALITKDLRQPLSTILGLGVTLEGYAAELPVERLQRIGTSIRQQAERMPRPADDRYPVSRIETQALIMNRRPTDLRRTAERALGTTDHPEGVQLEIARHVVVQADARRL